jgi:cell division inhibitor SulA
MPKYVIERDLPDAGKLSPQQLCQIARQSRAVLGELGPQIQWVESFVADDRIYCLYIAPDAEIIREHARRGGFPAERISEVRITIDPTTAE